MDELVFLMFPILQFLELFCDLGFIDQLDKSEWEVISLKKKEKVGCLDLSWIKTMWKNEEGNQTAIKEFILLGYGDQPELQPLLLSLFLMIYILTLAGNFLIILLVVADQHLQTPMYYFLSNLSFLEICYSSVTLLKMLSNLITGERTISVSGCIAQLFFFGFFAAIETYLLAAMSYDRYLAICKPLHYASIMHGKLCVKLMAGPCISSLLGNGIVAYLMAQISFCGPNVIDHYFCDLIPMEKLSCSDTSLIDLFAFLLCALYTITPFLLTLMSYVCIIATILKIPSAIGRKKAFLTCSSHLTVVCIFYSTIIIVYMLPATLTLRDLNKVFSLFYTILTPLINPLIYSLRNKDVHKALRMVCSRWLFFVRSHLNLSRIRLNSSLSSMLKRQSEVLRHSC
ncbi:olfactory receptor 1-like [Podarcis raffonei]|uniref:olfactory receptor 1-like n=1 Tax=Podarcis raffonei TaxID=65483 RepID=UPI0023290C8E|nr:olfactory receptor 1-like [Podarcis raffonei]